MAVKLIMCQTAYFLEFFILSRTIEYFFAIRDLVLRNPLTVLHALLVQRNDLLVDLINPIP